MDEGIAAGQLKVKRLSQVESEMQATDAAILEAHTLLDSLQGVLVPILREPDQPEPPEIVSEAITVPLALHLRKHRRNIEELNYRIKATRERVEL